MSVYFIHAEVIEKGVLVTKVCAIATCSSAEDAFNWFMSSDKVTNYISNGRDVIIDKLEKVE